VAEHQRRGRSLAKPKDVTWLGSVEEEPTRWQICQHLTR